MFQVNKVTVAKLKQMSEKMYGGIVKADVDIARRIMVIDAELHADIEQFMIDGGSRQDDLWGINLNPDHFGTENFIEFDSIINIRPRQGNMSRYVEDAAIRDLITEIVKEAVTND